MSLDSRIHNYQRLMEEQWIWNSNLPNSNCFTKIFHVIKVRYTADITLAFSKNLTKYVDKLNAKYTTLHTSGVNCMYGHL